MLYRYIFVLFIVTLSPIVSAEESVDYSYMPVLGYVENDTLGSGYYVGCLYIQAHNGGIFGGYYLELFQGKNGNTIDFGKTGGVGGFVRANYGLSYMWDNSLPIQTKYVGVIASGSAMVFRLSAGYYVGLNSVANNNKLVFSLGFGL